MTRVCFSTPCADAAKSAHEVGQPPQEESPQYPEASHSGVWGGGGQQGEECEGLWEEGVLRPCRGRKSGHRSVLAPRTQQELRMWGEGGISRGRMCPGPKWGQDWTRGT